MLMSNTCDKHCCLSTLVAVIRAVPRSTCGCKLTTVKGHLRMFRPFQRLRLVKRDQWGALPPQSTEPLPHPIELLRYVMNTGTPRCNNYEECLPIVQQLQKDHMEKGLGDIRYNFLLGNDGTVFEGRGWKCKPPLDPAYADKDGMFVEIAFIGDYRRDIVSTKWLEGPMYEAQWELLYYADARKYLAKDYDYIHETDREPRPRPPPRHMQKKTQAHVKPQNLDVIEKAV